MILLTGASGTVGTALLRRLLAADRPVRCLVRDPRELGPERVRVQIALGDLRVPSSFRHAMRGVDCVVHLATATRDAREASIEELNGLATLRLVRAAEAAGAERFVLLSSLGASLHSGSRLLRSKAMAERAVTESALATTILAPSLVIAPRDRWVTILDRLSWLPAMPTVGNGTALYQPIFAGDVAACIIASLDDVTAARIELAGPDTLTHNEIVAVVLRARGRRRRLVPMPSALVRTGLVALERAVGPATFATADEADLLETSLTTSRGTHDAELLGVRPAPLSSVLPRVA
jgi:NADH dehydrogenase